MPLSPSVAETRYVAGSISGLQDDLFDQDAIDQQAPAVPAAPYLITSVSSSNLGNNQIVLTVPTGVTGEHLGVIVIGTATSTAQSPTLPGWTTRVADPAGQANSAFYVLTRLGGHFAGDTLTIALAGSVSARATATWYATGGADVAAVGAPGTRNATSSAVLTVPSVTTTNSNSFVIVIAAERTTATGTSVVSWSPATPVLDAFGEDTASNAVSQFVGHYTQSSVGPTGDYTVTYSGGSTNAAAVQLVLAPPRALPSGLLMLFRGDTLTSVTDGASVTSWTDTVGGRVVTTSSSSPTKLGSGTNGQPAVRFNGVDQGLQMSGPPAVNQPYTVFAVVTMSGGVTGQDRQIFWQGSGGGLLTTTAARWASFGGATRTGTIGVTNSPTVFTSAFSSDGFPSRQFVNGTLDVAANVGTGAINQGVLQIGRHPSLARWWQGDIYELRIYDHALSVDERAQLHSYVQDRYGIAVADYAPTATVTYAVGQFFYFFG